VKIQGKLAVSDCAWFGGHISVKNGHIFTEQAQMFNFAVQPLQGGSLLNAIVLINSIFSRCTTTTGIGVSELITLRDYEICCSAEFSYRNIVQYKTEDFFFYEARWQQLARQDGQSLEVWGEKPVLFQGTETFPYPGKEKWKDEPTWRTLDVHLYDVLTGRAVDREGPYLDPAFNGVSKVIPECNYTIVAK